MSARRFIITAIGPHDAFYREGVKSPFIGKRFRLIEGETLRVWPGEEWSYGEIFITSKPNPSQCCFHEFKYRELPARKAK